MSNCQSVALCVCMFSRTPPRPLGAFTSFFGEKINVIPRFNLIYCYDLKSKVKVTTEAKVTWFRTLKINFVLYILKISLILKLVISRSNFINKHMVYNESSMPQEVHPNSVTLKLSVI